MKHLWPYIWNFLKGILAIIMLLFIIACLIIYSVVYILWNFTLPTYKHYKCILQVDNDQDLRWTEETLYFIWPTMIHQLFNYKRETITREQLSSFNSINLLEPLN